MSIITVYIKNTCQTTFAFVIFLYHTTHVVSETSEKSSFSSKSRSTAWMKKGVFIASQILNILHDSLWVFSYQNTYSTGISFWDSCRRRKDTIFHPLCTWICLICDQSILRSIPFYRYHRTHRLHTRKLWYSQMELHHFTYDPIKIYTEFRKNWARSRRSIFSSHERSHPVMRRGWRLFRWAFLHCIIKNGETRPRSSSCHPTCSQNL